MKTETPEALSHAILERAGACELPSRKAIAREIGISTSDLARLLDGSASGAVADREAMRRVAAWLGVPTVQAWMLAGLLVPADFVAVDDVHVAGIWRALAGHPFLGGFLSAKDFHELPYSAQLLLGVLLERETGRELVRKAHRVSAANLADARERRGRQS